MIDRFGSPRTAENHDLPEAGTGYFGGMLTGLTSSSSEELDRLRQRYERLCDLMTRTAEADPDGAERVLSELQDVSEKLLVLEAGGTAPTPETAPEPAAPIAEAADNPALPEPPTPVSSEAPPANLPTDRQDAAPEPAAPATAAQPSPSPPRVVAFRATPAAEPAPTPTPTAPPATPTDDAARAAASQHAGGATVFSAAIRQWLEDRRRAPADPVDEAERTHERPHADARAADAASARAPVSATARRPDPTPTEPAARRTTQPEAPLDLTRIVSAVEQQATQIERILALCEAHQLALERLEARIEAQHAAAESAAPEPDPEIPDLRVAVEEQRRRVTALAKTIHNLAQWLAAQRTLPGR